MLSKHFIVIDVTLLHIDMTVKFTERPFGFLEFPE